METPEKFKNLAEAVRNEVYGKDVREAIAKSIEETGTSSETAIKITEQLIDGSFDEAELTTEIEQRLEQLEQDYAPELNNVKSQLAQTVSLSNIKNVVTVGEGGDFTTINKALESLSYKRPQYKMQSETGEQYINNGLFEIRLLPGFIMKEQVLLEGGVNLGYVVISSDEDVVEVDRESLIQETSYGRKPIFSGHFNCVLPIINTLFDINDKEKIENEDDYTSGIYCVGNSSVIVTSGSGVNGAGRGIHVNGGSNAYAREGNFNYCYRGIRVSQGSQISARDIKAMYCYEHGAAIANGCTVDMRGGDVSFSNEEGLSVGGGSFVDFARGTSVGCGSYGVSSTSAGIVNCFSATINNNRIGVHCYQSQIDIHRAQIKDNVEYDVYGDKGALIKARYSSTTNSTRDELNLIDTNMKRLNVVDIDTGALMIGDYYDGVENRHIAGSYQVSVPAKSSKTFNIPYPEGETFAQFPIGFAKIETEDDGIYAKAYYFQNDSFHATVFNDTDNDIDERLDYFAISRTTPYGDY